MRLYDTEPTLITAVDFDNNNAEIDDNHGVKNDGMSDQHQQPKNLQTRSAGVAAATGGTGANNNLNNNGANGDNRPGSARSNRERHERVIMLKERQNSERIKKLEELKEQALAASRLREEQDSKRRKHFEELGKRDDERRRQAEERRRMLEEERKMTLQAKWETKRNNLMSSSMNAGSKANKPTYAFGSCTPRLLDNHIDGFLWKSQYNLNVMKEPGIRASSAHDLHLQQKEVRLSTSMYEWNQHRTTPENPLLLHSSAENKRGSGGPRAGRLALNNKNESMMDGGSSRVFCGRRKTDLTPTIPIKRDDYTMMMSRSTSRGSGRVYSSMTRLDRSRSPGGSLTQYQPNNHQSSNPHLVGAQSSSPQRPSRSKSTTHLHSAGLKLTRTEILRQALANKKDNAAGVAGIRSVDASRPPSSMSSSIMTSSTHSQVQMRPRTSYVRKARPASVHVTGVSNDHATSSSHHSETMSSSTKDSASSSRRSETPASSVKSAVSRKTSNEIKASRASAAAASSGKSSGKTSPSLMETSTIKRAAKKKPSLSVAKTPEPTRVDKSPEPSSNNVNVVQVQPEPAPANENNNSSKEIINNAPNKVDSIKTADNFESIESAFASGSEDFNSKTPEPFARAASSDSASNTVSELLESSATGGRDSASTIEDTTQQWSNPFNENVTPEPTKELLKPADDDNSSSNIDQQRSSPMPGGEGEDDGSQKPPKIMTEEEAKAALAEKRRLAREAAEREAARIAELERLELERQRLEEEEAERLAMEARRLEEERLRKAIEEEQKRQEEEKKRREEEEKARIEKEKQERAAAKEAERIRLEMEERLRKEEAERLERKRRVEAIMSRTRKKEAEAQQQQQQQQQAAQQQAKANLTNSNNATSEIILSQQNDLNGHKDNIINQENIMQSSVNSLNNNFNNNNDFSGGGGAASNNDDLMIDNNTTPASSTLISFEGMSAPQSSAGGNIDNAVDLLNFSQQQQPLQVDSNISPDLLGSTNTSGGTTTGASPTPVLLVGNNSLNNSSASPNNSIITSNPLQGTLNCDTEVFIIDLLS